MAVRPDGSGRDLWIWHEARLGANYQHLSPWWQEEQRRIKEARLKPKHRTRRYSEPPGLRLPYRREPSAGVGGSIHLRSTLSNLHKSSAEGDLDALDAKAAEQRDKEEAIRQREALALEQKKQRELWAQHMRRLSAGMPPSMQRELNRAAAATAANKQATLNGTSGSGSKSNTSSSTSSTSNRNGSSDSNGSQHDEGDAADEEEEQKKVARATAAAAAKRRGASPPVPRAWPSRLEPLHGKPGEAGTKLTKVGTLSRSSVELRRRALSVTDTSDSRRPATVPDTFSNSLSELWNDCGASPVRDQLAYKQTFLHAKKPASPPLVRSHRPHTLKYTGFVPDITKQDEELFGALKPNTRSANPFNNSPGQPKAWQGLTTGKIGRP